MYFTVKEVLLPEAAASEALSDPARLLGLFSCVSKHLNISLPQRYITSDSCNTMDHSLPGSSVHGILQARILEWVAISFQGIFVTQGSNQGLLYCKQILYHHVLFYNRVFFH